MNRISSPLAFLPEAIPPPENEDSITGSQNCFDACTVVTNACNPFREIDIGSTVLDQAKKTFTCFNWIFNACCIDAANVCSSVDPPPSALGSLIYSRELI